MTVFTSMSYSSKSAKRKFNYEWGDLAPATRRIAGKLIDSQPQKMEPLSGTFYIALTYRSPARLLNLEAPCYGECVHHNV